MSLTMNLRRLNELPAEGLRGAWVDLDLGSTYGTEYGTRVVCRVLLFCIAVRCADAEEL